MENFRFDKDGPAYFVTFAVVDWLPVFVTEQACQIVTNSLNFCHDNKGLRTHAYVIMPTHVHGIFFHETFDGELLLSALTDFRKFTGRSLSDLCARQMPRCFTEALRAAAAEDRARRFWQATRHPEVIYTERFCKQKTDYLHDNPRRKGLVTCPDHWRFSSAEYWFSGGSAPNDVRFDAIPWR